MDYAKHGNDVVSYVEDPSWLKMLSSIGALKCPVCENKVLYVIQHRGQNYFKHHKGVVSLGECNLYVPGSGITTLPTRQQVYYTIEQFPNILDQTPSPDLSKFSSIVTIHSRPQGGCLFKLTIDWSGGGGQNLLVVRTYSGHRVKVSLDRRSFSHSYVIDINAPLLEVEGMIDERIKYYVDKINHFFQYHRYLIKCKDNEGEILNSPYFLRTEIESVYDRFSGEIISYPLDESYFEKLFLDGYLEVLPSDKLFISSRYIKRINLSSALIELSSFKNISIRNISTETIELALVYFDKSGFILLQKKIIAGVGTTSIDLSFPDVNRIEVSGIGCLFNLFLADTKEIEPALVERYTPKLPIPQLIESDNRLYNSRFERFGWLFKKIKNSESFFVDTNTIVSKKEWDNILLGMEINMRDDSYE